MARGSSTSPLVHSASHGWWQTLPQAPGKGCSSLKSFKASLYCPLPMRAIKPWILTWAGQVTLQGAVDRFEIAKAPGMACSYFLKTAFLLLRPWSCSLGTSTGQTVVHSPQLVHLARSMYLGFSLIFAVKFSWSPLSSRRSVLVKSSMFRCRPTSTSFGEITHMVQSFVGNVLSSSAIMPPMAEFFSTR